MNNETPSTLSELIAAVSGELTPTERRVAEAVLADPTLLAFGTVSDLAERVSTSRPSIVRFANKLGFEGFTELQQHVRNTVSLRLFRPSERIRRGDPERRPILAAIEGAIASVFRALEGERMDRLVTPIVEAEQVWILSGETSRAGAHALHSGLTMLRPGVKFLGSHTLGTDLSSAKKADVAVVFDFVRYRRRVTAAAELLRELGVHLVAVTDSPLSPLVALTDNWCEIEIPAVGPFDSSVPTVLLAELLVARVAERMHSGAKERLDRIEALWKRTRTFAKEEQQDGA